MAANSVLPLLVAAAVLARSGPEAARAPGVALLAALGAGVPYQDEDELGLPGGLPGPPPPPPWTGGRSRPEPGPAAEAEWDPGPGPGPGGGPGRLPDGARPGPVYFPDVHADDEMGAGWRSDRRADLEQPDPALAGAAEAAEAVEAVEAAVDAPAGRPERGPETVAAETRGVAGTVQDQTERPPGQGRQPTPSEGRTSTEDDGQPADGGLDDEDLDDLVEQRSVPDSEAVASETLPMAAPLSMGGRGPPMTLSLEDMDFLTILRPPQPPKQATTGAKGGKGSNQRGASKTKRKATNNNRNNNNRNNNTNKSSSSSNNNKANKGMKQTSVASKGKGSNKNRQKTAQGGSASSSSLSQQVSAGPGPGPTAYPDSYSSGFSTYEPPHPYGYGYGYSSYDFPRYPDPVMTHEYQQASSYPEEERFRPLPPHRGPHGGLHQHQPYPMAPAGPPGPMLGPAAASPMTPSLGVPLGAPMASMTSAGAPAAGYDPYQNHYFRDPAAAASLQHDQRPSGSGAVQVTQSVSAGEHHSTSTSPSSPSLDPSSWLSSLGPGLTGLGTSPTTGPTASSGAGPAASATSTPDAAARKATLKDILVQDCPGAEDLGYCDSPPRYPMQQVSEAIERCSQLIDHMYAPPPEERDPENDGQGEGACQAVRRSLRPGYVRDSASGRWLVALQARGRLVQKVAVERCSAPGKPCARLADSKCARNLGFRNGARSTSCEQRTALLPVLTWDPETPATCPRVRLARFPVACVCRVA